MDYVIPRGGGLPLPVPGTSAKPSAAGSEDDDKDGPACPPMQNDVPHGAKPPAERFEAMIARLVNPSNPTPKRTPETLDVTSQAYFLPQPGMPSGRVSYDDCKRTNEASPILGIAKGDMVDARSKGTSFVYYYPSLDGFDEFERQVRYQDDAVDREHKGRRVFQCVYTEKDAQHLTALFRGRFKHTLFRACHL